MNAADLKSTNAVAGNAFFTVLAADIADLLDLHPEGITQERVWSHRKKLGRVASVDQIRLQLDKLTRAAELVSAKNGKNETVWKRAARGGLVTAKPTTLIGEKPSEQTVTQAVAAAVMRAHAEARASHEPPAAPIPTDPPPPAEEPQAMTPPVDPPKPAANAKPIVHTRRARLAGEAIEAAVLETLAQGACKRSVLLLRTGASDTGITNALQRLASRIERTPSGEWALKGTASGGAATQPAAPPPAAPLHSPRHRLRRRRYTARGTAAHEARAGKACEAHR